MNILKSKLMNLSSINLSKGNPIKVITLFAIPLIIANLFQMLYTTVDTMVVGKYVSSLALASVGATSPVIDLLLGLAIGLCNGLSIVIAKHIGSNDKEATKKSIVNGFYLIVIVSTIVMVLGLLFNKLLFNVINVSPNLMQGAMTYSTIIFIGTLFAAIYNYESAVLRAYGNSMVPLLFLILCICKMKRWSYTNIIFRLVYSLG